MSGKHVNIYSKIVQHFVYPIFSNITVCEANQNKSNLSEGRTRPNVWATITSQTFSGAWSK